MIPITYLAGDATDPQASGMKIIAHCCNDLGRWGKGFVLAISKRWSEPEDNYRSWSRLGESGRFRLGAVQFVPVRNDIVIANLIGQHGIKSGSKGPPIRYEAIATALAGVSERAIELGASVHMPRIGCGLAGGKWERIEPLILSTLSSLGVPVFVYDYGS